MNEPANNTSPDDGEVNLLDYLIILAKHSRMIIFASAAVTVLTYFILFIQPNKYTTKARLLPPRQNLTLSAQLLDSLGGRASHGAEGVDFSMGSMASSLLGLKSPADLYIAMMGSNTVLDHLITRFHLMKLYKTKYFEEARKALSKNVKFTAGKKDNIIVIEVTSTTPKMAAEMANAFIEELDRLLQKLAVQEAKGRLAFLEKERLQASLNLTKAEDSLRLFSEKNKVLQIDTQTKGAIQYIARLRAEIDAREVSIQVLRQQATPLNYDVIRLETEVEGLKEKLRTAESQRGDCENNVCIPTDKAPALGLEYFRLFRDTQYQQSLYQLFTKLVEIAHLDMVRDVSVVQVIDPGKTPEMRSNKRLSPSILAGMITFFMMSFVALCWELLHNLNLRESEGHRFTVLMGYLTPWKDILIRMKDIIIFKRR